MLEYVLEDDEIHFGFVGVVEFLEVRLNADVHLVERIDFFVNALFRFKVHIHVVAKHQASHVQFLDSPTITRQMLVDVVKVLLLRDENTRQTIEILLNGQL